METTSGPKIGTHFSQMGEGGRIGQPSAGWLALGNNNFSNSCRIELLVKFNMAINHSVT